jgi:hypothetical protein
MHLDTGWDGIHEGGRTFHHSVTSGGRSYCYSCHAGCRQAAVAMPRRFVADYITPHYHAVTSTFTVIVCVHAMLKGQNPLGHEPLTDLFCYQPGCPPCTSHFIRTKTNNFTRPCRVACALDVNVLQRPCQRSIPERNPTDFRSAPDSSTPGLPVRDSGSSGLGTLAGHIHSPCTYGQYMHGPMVHAATNSRTHGILRPPTKGSHRCVEYVHHRCMHPY